MDRPVSSAFIVLMGSILLYAASATAAPPPPETSLNTCQNKVRVQGRLFLQNYVNAVGTCLQRVSTEVVKKNAADVASAANTCIAQFRKINDTRALGLSLEEKLRAKIQDKCTPGGDNTHNADDILGGDFPSVSEPLEAENIGNWCGQFGGSGDLASLTDWLDCIVDSYTLLARTAVTVSYPRALEWLDEVRPYMAFGVPAPADDPTKVSDALAGLDALNLAVEGLNDDDRPATQAGTSAPATGQTTSYGAGSDGDVQAGAPLRYVDNDDGTITDLNTGLMWEKKSDDSSIHDQDNTYKWCADADVNLVCDTVGNPMDGTMVTTFLATLNGGGGFAGYTDWRIPNRKELESILNLENVFPAVSSEFNTGCVATCTVTTCSCTQSNSYWSSTTYQYGPDFAWFVYFVDGYVGNGSKSGGLYVRAVRGGS